MPASPADWISPKLRSASALLIFFRQALHIADATGTEALDTIGQLLMDVGGGHHGRLRSGPGRFSMRCEEFRDGFFPFLGGQIKDEFETLKREFSPDLVFTHHRDDRHQDHRLISDLTWNTFRSHLILEYEIPKYDGDLVAPNFFVPLEKSACSRKIQIIIDSFNSQSQKQWFDEETFLAILRLRGIEANSPTRYAEGFYCRKAVLG